MQSHTRAIVAATVHALVTGAKVASLYDHSTGRHLQIAAEARGSRLQGYDGDRNARFGGTLPEIRYEGDGASICLKVEARTVLGYDRHSKSYFVAEVSDRLVQVYDHSEAAWFAYGVNVA